MKEKNIILTARIMSMLFTPFYLPLVGLVALFLFSYMSLLPLAYKLPMLLTVYLFTILLPSVLIHIYRRYQGWSTTELGKKERRIVPYIISIVCYFGCFFLMEYRNTPRVISIILVAALIIQMVCAFINIWWKISTHTRCGRSLTGLFYQFLVQPHLVALSGTHPGRHGRYSTNDTAPTQPVAGCNRILHRTRLRLPRHLREKTVSRNNRKQIQ